MDIPSAIAPQVVKPPQPITPSVQAELNPAVIAAQQTTQVVRTQTSQAPQATGKTEAPQSTRTATQTGQAIDTEALVATVRGQRAYGGRGSFLNLSA